MLCTVACLVAVGGGSNGRAIPGLECLVPSVDVRASAGSGREGSEDGGVGGSLHGESGDAAGDHGTGDASGRGSRPCGVGHAGGGVSAGGRIVQHVSSAASHDGSGTFLQIVFSSVAVGVDVGLDDGIGEVVVVAYWHWETRQRLEKMEFNMDHIPQTLVKVVTALVAGSIHSPNSLHS